MKVLLVCKSIALLIKIIKRFRYNNPDPNFANIYGELVPYTGIDTLARIQPYTLKWGHFDPADVFGFWYVERFYLNAIR